jgi:hypothetical protein
MRPLIVADPIFLAPSPEIVSESNLADGVWAIVALASASVSASVQKQTIDFVFIEGSSWVQKCFYLRLCRLMCGKAAPYRQHFFFDF